MMWRIRLAFIALSGFISIHCWAVDIEVTQASPMATPIAVFQFAGSSQFQGMPSQLSDVIRHDLTDMVVSMWWMTFELSSIKCLVSSS